MIFAKDFTWRLYALLVRAYLFVEHENIINIKNSIKNESLRIFYVKIIRYPNKPVLPIFMKI